MSQFEDAGLAAIGAGNVLDGGVVATARGYAQQARQHAAGEPPSSLQAASVRGPGAAGKGSDTTMASHSIAVPSDSATPAATQCASAPMPAASPTGSSGTTAHVGRWRGVAATGAPCLPV